MKLDFGKLTVKRHKVLMAVVQDFTTRQVLMVGVMTKRAVEKTIKTGLVTFWSRSEKKLWTKGETSGNFLLLKKILVDCDQDTLLILAEPRGPTCHTGATSCFENTDGTEREWVNMMSKAGNARVTNPIRVVGPDGSMEDWFRTTLTRGGIDLIEWDPRTKQAATNVEWISSVTLQRPQEIPVYMKLGHFDVAVVGEDWLANWKLNWPRLLVVPVGRQGGKVKIVLAASKKSGFKSCADLKDGIVVATEYVELAKAYFKKLGVKAKIISSCGNTEHKVQYGADAIIDVTETGNSLRQNGLEIIDTLLETGMAIVARPEIMNNPETARYVDHFVAVVKGAIEAASMIRIEANVPKAVCDKAAEILGGLTGATIAPLAKSDWVSLTSYVDRSREHEVVFALRELGVKGIAVLRDIPLLMS